MNNIFITGTDTGVGKTLISAALTAILRQDGHDAGIMKPVAAGGTADTDFLTYTAGVADDRSLVTPYCLKTPAAPLIAAEHEGVTIDKDVIINAYKELSRRHEILIVEGVGGILVPITENFLVSDMIREMDIPIIIVARPSLGTINHTLLTIRHAQSQGMNILGFIINNFDREHAGISEREAPNVIERIGKVPLLGVTGHVKDPFSASGFRDFVNEVRNLVKLDTIFPNLRKEKRVRH